MRSTGDEKSVEFFSLLWFRRFVRNTFEKFAESAKRYFARPTVVGHLVAVIDNNLGRKIKTELAFLSFVEIIFYVLRPFISNSLFLESFHLGVSNLSFLLELSSHSSMDSQSVRINRSNLFAEMVQGKSHDVEVTSLDALDQCSAISLNPVRPSFV